MNFKEFVLCLSSATSACVYFYHGISSIVLLWIKAGWHLRRRVPRVHFPGGIWKQRFHSEDASSVYLNTTGEIESAALFLRFGLLSTLIRHENEAFWERSSKTGGI